MSNRGVMIIDLLGDEETVILSDQRDEDTSQEDRKKLLEREVPQPSLMIISLDTAT